MSDTAGPAALPVGPVLRDATILVLRHWLLLAFSFVAFAEGVLLGLHFLNRCLASPDGWCRSPLFQIFGGGGQPEWSGSIALSKIVGLLVLVLALYFFYSSPRLGVADGHALRGSSSGAARFVARTAAIWLAFLFLAWLVDFLLTRITDTLPILSMSDAMRWLVFILRGVLMAAIGAYLQARLAFYLPSMAFREEPGSIGDAWRRTRPVALRLFVLFLVIQLVSGAAQIGLLAAAYRLPWLIALWGEAAHLFGVRSNFMMLALPPAAIFGLIGVPQTLLEAAVCLTAYRRVTLPELTATAEVFA